MGFWSGGFTGAFVGGGIGTVAGTVGGLMLAPFTLGTSLLIGPLIGGFLGALGGGLIGAGVGLLTDDDKDKDGLSLKELKALLAEDKEKEGGGLFAGMFKMLSIAAVGLGALELVDRENPNLLPSWAKPPQFVTNLVNKAEEALHLVDDKTPQSPRTKAELQELKLAEKYPDLCGPGGTIDVTKISELEARKLLSASRSDEGKEILERQNQQIHDKKVAEQQARDDARDGHGGKETQILENFIEGRATAKDTVSKDEREALESFLGRQDRPRDVTVQDLAALHEAYKDNKFITTVVERGLLNDADKVKQANDAMVSTAMNLGSLADEVMGQPTPKQQLEAQAEGKREYDLINNHINQVRGETGKFNAEETLALLKKAHETHLTQEMINEVHNEYSHGPAPAPAAASAPPKEQAAAASR